MDPRPILFVVGILLTTLSLTMALPALVDLAAGSPDWRVFGTAGALTLFIGVALILTNRGTSEGRLSIRQAFLLTTASWVSIAIFAALPFVFAGLSLSITDALFESVSGITTTGATVIVGLDEAPPGILLWRALLQWLGGVGIIVTAVAILPVLQVGGMQLFRMENSDTSDKALPRAAQIAGGIAVIYAIFTLLCFFALIAAGIPAFDALAHAMTTIATGGFSTSDASIGGFNNPAAEWIITIGMAAGALPFVLYLQAVRGRAMLLWRDAQVRGFFTILLLAITILSLAHIYRNEVAPLEALRYVAFNATSVMTGTGFATADYGAWGSFATSQFFFLMFIGGCAGSTACGMKIFRFQVLFAAMHAQIRRLIQPHSVIVPHYNNRPVTTSVIESVMVFFFGYVACYAILSVILGLLGLDFITAVSGAATAISNVGPGLGPIIGPAGTFAPLPDAAKWVLCFAMLLGRLELFTVLILLTPAFWRS